MSTYLEAGFVLIVIAVSIATLVASGVILYHSIKLWWRS